MTKEEYYKWKKENPSNYKEMVIETMKEWIKMFWEHDMDETAFLNVTTNEERKNVTYGMIAEVLCKQDDSYDNLFDDLVRMYSGFLININTRIKK